MADTVSVTQMPTLNDCPICGSRPRRGRRQDRRTVVCYGGSHRLEVIADDTVLVSALWNETAADWVARNSPAGQAARAGCIIEAVAAIEHIARVKDNGLNSHARQLREAARILLASTQPAPAFPRDKLADIADRIERQATYLEGYAEQAGHSGKAPASVYHWQATHFRDLAKELAALLQGKQP